MSQVLEGLPQEIPTIKAIYIAAILDRAVAQGADPDRLLQGTLLAKEAVFDTEAFLPTACAYAAVERAQRMCGNPHLAAEVAATFHKPGSLLRVSAGYTPESVSDFLITYIKEATVVQSSVKFSMLVKADAAILRGTRVFCSPQSVGQGDAWDISAWVTILRTLMTDAWNVTRVRAWVADPKAVPPVLLPPNQIQTGDKSGTQIEFPSEWLTVKLVPGTVVEQSDIAQYERRPTLQDVFSAFDLRSLPNADGVAHFLGLTPRTFHRRLAKYGTTFSDMIEELREMRACELLLGNRSTVREIATLLGYRNESSFNRAFKRWRGLSPSAFRTKYQ